MIEHLRNWFEAGAEAILGMNKDAPNIALMVMQTDVKLRKWVEFLQDGGHLAGWRLVDAKTGAEIRAPGGKPHRERDPEAARSRDFPRLVLRDSLIRPLATLKAESWDVANFDFFVYARFLSFSFSRTIHVCIYFMAIDENRRVVIRRKDVSPNDTNPD